MTGSQLMGAWSSKLFGELCYMIVGEELFELILYNNLSVLSFAGGLPWPYLFDLSSEASLRQPCASMSDQCGPVS